MGTTRRQWMQSALALAALGQRAPAQPQRKDPWMDVPDSEIRVPKVRFGELEISRLIVGANPFLGFSHHNNNFNAVMRQWYTPERVVEVLKRCQAFGVNAYNYVHMGRAQADWEKFVAEGGRMHLIAQATTSDPAELVKAVRPYAAWVQGERVDDAWQSGDLAPIRDYCKRLRDLGVRMVGVASHIPEVLMEVESQGWDVDFYAGCVYNRRRTPEELRKYLGGHLPVQPRELYLQDDPPRMYAFMRATSKPCVAFKILAAGRVNNVEEAFKQAFASLKPIDLVCVGFFPAARDEVKENCFYAMKYGAVAT